MGISKEVAARIQDTFTAPPTQARLVVRRRLPDRRVIVERPARLRYGTGRVARPMLRRRVAEWVPAYETVESEPASGDMRGGFRWGEVPSGTVVALRVYRGDDLLFETAFTPDW